MTNYYQVLGVPTDATGEQIKAAYREYAKNLHPDKHTNSEFFKRRFQEVQHAYDILSDSTARSNFDRQFNKGTGSKSTYDATITELNSKIRKLDADLLSKDRLIKRKEIEVQICLAESEESKKKTNELVVKVESLELQLSKKVNRESYPSKGRVLLNNLKYFFRPPISYALFAVVLIIGIASFVNLLPDKRINMVEAFTSFRKADEKKNYSYILHKADSLLKTNAPLNESKEDVEWGDRKLERADLLLARGFAKWDMKNDTGAMRDLTNSIRHYSMPTAVPLSHRADLRLQLGDTTGALDDATRALLIERGNSRSRRTRGGIYLERHQYRLALADYSAAHKKDSQDDYSLNEMGRCYLVLHKTDSACIMFRKASELGNSAAIDNVKNFCK